MPAEGLPPILTEYVEAFGAARDARQPKVTIRPMHLTLWDEAQITNVRKPIGYRWECSCGKYGRIRRKRPEAVAEGAEHRTVHGRE